MKILEKYLGFAKRYQKRTYDELKHSFSIQYEKIKNTDIDRFIIQAWVSNNDNLKVSFDNYPPYDFLRLNSVRNTMFVYSPGEWLEKQIQFLEQNIPYKTLKKVLYEDPFGKPYLVSYKYITSHNSIHLLYHLCKFMNTTKSDFNAMDTVIDWGGGYGNLIKIMDRLINKKLTYIIIDTPLFSCLQWLYLSVVTNKERVNIITSKEQKVEEKKINLLPVSFLEDFELHCDLFVSTWALSESSDYSQDYVYGKDFFKAGSLLIGFQRSNEKMIFADRIEILLKNKGALIEELGFIPDNFYGFL
ncbi:MAG: hypothetical protein JXA60_09520 [Candidatus Coatesbacteria bacterium]|nr:hypothetical protein [Candidatus Coatesbacteria bacterium]